MKTVRDAKPLALQLLPYFPGLVEFQHFELEEGIWEFIAQIVNDEMSDFNAVPFKAPQNSYPPADKMTLAKAGMTRLYVINRTLEGSVGIGQVFSDGHIQGVGGYTPGGAFGIHDSVNPEDAAVAESVLLEVALGLAVLNQPRVVEKSPLLPRQQRRAYHRGMGFAVDAWTRVTWDLSKATKSKLSRDPSFHPKPYHFCRGHLRRAEKHYKGAFQLVDAIRPEDREGWWQWIDECWKGHPAFGIKKSVHAPKMTSGRLAQRGKAA